MQVVIKRALRSDVNWCSPQATVLLKSVNLFRHQYNFAKCAASGILSVFRDAGEISTVICLLLLFC